MSDDDARDLELAREGLARVREDRDRVREELARMRGQLRALRFTSRTHHHPQCSCPECQAAVSVSAPRQLELSGVRDGVRWTVMLERED